MHTHTHACHIHTHPCMTLTELFVLKKMMKDLKNLQEKINTSPIEGRKQVKELYFYQKQYKPEDIGMTS